jgi:hydroxymethylbilane synthase
MSKIRIATRNSPLALWQAEYVKQRLMDVHQGITVEIVGMTTQGDQLLDRSLSKAGGKGLFLKELEISLLNGETDIAVHSMKDVPVSIPEGLEIPVVCEREDPRDAFVSNEYQNLYALPQGARIGTSSLRRVSQLKSAFPKLEFIPLRGNVNTRLAKLDEGQYDAIILAAAGLIRLGFAQRIKQYITPELCLPAVGQGIVGIECRIGDTATRALIAPLHDRESALLLAAERTMNAVLNGGCQAPIAGHARASKGRIRMRGMVAAMDGSSVLYANLLSESLRSEQAEQLGRDVGEELLKQGAAAFLAEASGEPVAVTRSSKPVVLLTRQHRFRGNMASMLEKLDCIVEIAETLQIDPRVDEKILAQFQNLNTYTDLLFVSRNAVEIGLALIADVQGQLPEKMNVMTVGPETAKQLKAHGINAFFPSRGTGAEALLAVDKMKDLRGRRILVVRGIGGLDWPSDEMRKRGAAVDHADVYEQSMPRDGKRQIDDILARHAQIHGVFIHSAQSAANFMELVASHAEKFIEGVMIVGSERIADVALELGWQQEIIIAESPSNKHMMMACSNHPKLKV